MDYSYQNQITAVQLADLFLKNKKYDSALYYLKYAASLRSVRNMCGSDNIINRTTVYHRFLLAYEGLNDIDSAISVFIPYAFQEWTNIDCTENSLNHIHPDDNHCQVLHLIRVLSKKHLTDTVRDELRNSTDQLYFTCKKVENDHCRYNIDCSISFFEHTINLNNSTYLCSEQTEENPTLFEDAKKQYAVELKSSLIYRLPVATPEL